MRYFAESILRRAAILYLIAFGTLHAQELPHTPQITISTHLVQISVSVRGDKDTAAVLSKDDFKVLVQGKPQKISVFEMESNGAPPPPAPQEVQNKFSDHAGGVASARGNITIILLDNLNTLVGSEAMPYEDTPTYMEDFALANAKQHLIEALKQFDSRDRIAIYGLSGSLRMLCDFTCDRDELLAVVKGYDPSSKTQREAVDPHAYHLPNVPEEFNQAINASNAQMAGRLNAARAQVTMMALKAIADHVAHIPGQKNLLWLTANLPFSGEAIARIVTPAKIAIYPVDARGLQAAQVNIKDTDSPAAAILKQPVGIEAMQEMADDTGGHAFVNTNDITGAIREVVEDSETRYTLGFYVDAASVDGKFHELKVHVDRPGMTLRAPTGYFALKDTPGSANQSRAALLAAIESPFDASALSLDVSVARVEQPKPHMLRLTGSVDIKDLPLAQVGDMRRGRLDVLVVEQGAAGNVLHQATNHLDLKLTETQYGEYRQSGIAFQQYLQPLPGTTVIRVLVRDRGTLQLGSVVIPLKSVQ